ncbi:MULTISPECIES: phosphoglycerate kinase [Rhodobacterales]|jgi:phosphoglycerate kinase|uniref:phosphoglycerate kinase n=1 Tax=Rhodobacterales TaxID=204455 RepID=UPI00237FD30F|nr:phosphoglycerate kinase [Phaeobacter gallaeciensis]MDE4139497.1 phosphoglycerate kinase [Phaeobacter gallaeciensis]MDE4147445.1 phosphoglycerate kinase [Phaeobacter gallaeciensis]MDE4151664.1 phosphoglycerate kinase [Phaeobacter gallaeciensis]MDE4227552.1 phosphoglycerate kinase [Phaeobacter gallaeciensis]MDE4256128.1 phosphoglycerate kinase [Phaeobacter gallaeciensis]
MGWNTLDDMDLSGKRVLVRVDINVPIVDGVVTDSTRIRRIAPTVHDILAAGGKPILLAHFGRPGGERRENLSLNQLIPTLERAFETKVLFAADCVGPGAEAAAAALQPGEVLLLENTRFHAEETKNDPDLAAGMARLGDVYCNDAFSAAHRAHSSTEGIARLLPACAGRLMQAELSALESALGAPKRPVTAVVGGAKVSTKLELLGNLIKKVDYLIIGGGMANTFLVAKGIDVGKSLAERIMKDTAAEILAEAESAGCKIILPSDVVVAEAFASHAPHQVLPADQCPAEGMILDAGPDSIATINEIFEQSQTLIWNGPLGAFELEPFDAATNAAALKAAALTRAGKLISVAGGGDTVAALNASGAARDFTYISTAGGAFLEWMEGKTLPGVAALDQE